MNKGQSALIIGLGGFPMENIYALVHLLAHSKARISLLVNEKLIMGRHQFY